MRIEKMSVKPAALFLFAHQDDEFGIYQKIVDELQAGSQICCAYLTDGSRNGVSAKRRNRESLAVLTHLEVREEDIFFAGEALSIEDGTLPEHLDRASGWIRNWLCSYPQIRSIYVPAWEGGHHDHDALHAITVSIAQMNDTISLVRQFPLYNGYLCGGPLFRVLLPLKNNGFVENRSIPWKNRLRFLRHCLSYPSQAKTWLGLFPFVFLHYLGRGTQTTQPVSIERLSQRPHAGPLYYERRRFFTWEQMANCLSSWSERK